VSHAAAVIRPQVLVVGAGSAGVAAAVAAAETGADTLLIEAGGHVGGTLARQLLEHSAGFHDASGNQVTGGVGQRVIALLQEYGGSPGHIRDDVAYTASRTPVNHAELSMCEAILLRRAGVTLLLNTLVIGVTADADVIRQVTTETSGAGRTTIEPGVVVDCSGDAVVFDLAGAAFQPGCAANTQPASLLLKLGGVDFGPLLRYAAGNPADLRPGSHVGSPHDDHVNLWGFGDLLQKGYAGGRLSWPRTELHLAGWPTRGEAVLNVTRLTLDPAHDRNAAYLALADQVMQTVAWFRDCVPGGRTAYLADVADRLGIRESRRIAGLATLTRRDVVGGLRSEQSVGLGAFPIDVHDATSPGMSHTDGLAAAYDIPYGVLVARDFTNLLAGGRCVSTTHEANGSARITATCFTTGEAAGCAAALAARDGADARHLDVRTLQARLRSRGAIGRWERPRRPLADGLDIP
jgi:FAD dependent oxidoreductase